MMGIPFVLEVIFERCDYCGRVSYLIYDMIPNTKSHYGMLVDRLVYDLFNLCCTLESSNEQSSYRVGISYLRHLDT